ncbi:MAG: hypothetical protein CMF39_06455 [Legionellaceae bacterium]|nr:hypothetical protein [Legionellaceae bacterium]|tara:strand:- start:241 stop:1083 length:843 start_codon:yes stop_codon:yes gene_type:complete
MNKLGHWFIHKLSEWMAHEHKPTGDEMPICDFDRICFEVRPGDVLLVEGTSRISNTIKILTRSNWSHAAIYIGHLYEIANRKLREHIINNYQGDVDAPLIIEGFLGKGTIVTSIAKYRLHHIRICRPRALSPEDCDKVIAYCIGAIGYDYNVRQIFDLLRLTMPVSIIPRRLFSSLFKTNRNSHRKICSSLLAEAFQFVNFPVLPKIVINKNGDIELVQRNPNLFAPGDFDYSPYFDIIKYPLFSMSESGLYHNLPWNQALISNDDGIYNHEDGKRTDNS